MSNSFNARTNLSVDGAEFEIFQLSALEPQFDVSRLPFSLKILLENLLRLEDGVDVTKDDIEALANWNPQSEPEREISFTPARVVLQDFTGVPAVVDLAAMREAMQELGGDPERINPLSPVDLVIDHSVQVDNFNSQDALDLNTRIEFQRNQERYAFLRWGQQTFSNFRVVPPGTGIVHQVNLEYLAPVVFTNEQNGKTTQAYPDTLVGTDSHTTMINGIGVLGWGVGGIEAEAGMLGQPISMLIPQVVGFRLSGELREGVTATDLVLTVTEMLRKHGVVGKFVEFFGDGLDYLPLTDRATIANMAPEYGATCGIFPIDKETLRYMELSGRTHEQVALVEAYTKAQGMFREQGSPDPICSDLLELDLSTVEPSLSGPKLPQDRIPLSTSKKSYQESVGSFRKEDGKGEIEVDYSGERFTLKDGAVVIAAITSCTNTSNPSVMVAAGVLARKAAEMGLKSKPWVKTSLAPGSQVVTEYLKSAGLIDDLEALGFSVVGYGCTTCIGNSGPLPEPIANGIQDAGLVTTSVLSGNRNFEGRIHQRVKMNYLASPPLVVAYAIAGTMDIDLQNDSLGVDKNGNEVYLRDIWPSSQEVQSIIQDNISSSMFQKAYDTVFSGDSRWQGLDAVASQRYNWDSDSTYIRKPTYFDGMGNEPATPKPITGARVLALLGDNVTTDHISPAGAIAADSPAGDYLQDQGVERVDFNSYGSRRGNHEVMMRGTFANIRLRNLLAPGTEGGWTRYQPDGDQMFIYEAAMRYREQDTPLVVLAGEQYGTGSSRDWAAKGTRLLGVKAVIAKSYERIHRSNLVGMGVFPLQFLPGEGVDTHGLDGTESYDIQEAAGNPDKLTVTATRSDGTSTSFQVKVRIDTPKEWDYFWHGGILHYVLRRLAAD